MEAEHKLNKTQQKEASTFNTLFDDQERFAESLKSENSPAVQYAIDIANRYLTSRYKFDKATDSLDLATDATVLVIHKIKIGEYHAGKSKISTFLISIAINLYRNYARKKKWNPQPIADHQYNMGKEDISLAEQMEKVKILEVILSATSESCRKLLELTYFQQLSDNEIIEKGHLHYKSTGALKNKRSKCLKELKEKYIGKIKSMNIL